MFLLRRKLFSTDITFFGQFRTVPQIACPYIGTLLVLPPITAGCRMDLRLKPLISK
ncbi:hypothetical protein BSU04_01525 [Caballeronia sordidicola]|uniref:Uncharacterized protein n=1 Tax=Caballeronia sordidicola TaxID=196367 RepID=A0A226XBW4_CABSO|nr:hypothetical protein BSU04_01525 [Caballeronia sordidicola]